MHCTLSDPWIVLTKAVPRAGRGSGLAVREVLAAPSSLRTGSWTCLVARRRDD